MSTNVLVRRLHYWGSALVAIPVALVLGTGLLLQLKKHWAWVQPVEHRGTGKVPVVDLHALLTAAKSIPERRVTSWAEIQRIDVRPDRGVAKLWIHDGWEVQVDLGTGQVLHQAYRRSDVIEALHDGTFFGTPVKLGIFLVSGLTLFGLWLTGCWMFLVTYLNKRRVRRRKQLAAASA